MNPKIMEGTYSFSPSGDYHSPEILEFKAVKDMILSLPLEDDPEVFGLN